MSKEIHSAPVATSTPSRSAVARGSVKNAGWRTSTAYRCDRGSRRRKPASVGTSDGLNDPGSWIQSAWARGPSGSIAARKARSSAPASVSRRSCVTAFGSFTTNRKSGPVCCAQEATVSRAGVA